MNWREKAAMEKQDRSSDWLQRCTRNDILMRNIKSNWQLGGNVRRITKDVRKAVENKTVDLLGDKEDYFELSHKNYVKPLSKLLLAEECYESIEMRKHDLFDTRVSIIYDSLGWEKEAQVKLYGLSKGQPSLIPSDFVVLEDCDKYEVLEITRIKGDTISFRPPQRRSKYRQMRFNISFVPSGITYDHYHYCLELVSSWDLLAMLFESPVSEMKQLKKIEIDSTGDSLVDLNERLSKCNDSQRQAIIGILEAKCRPKPYILFGPPGTGKTFTVVETVVQIYQRQPSARILICANSNNCADQLAAAIDATKLVRPMVRLCAQGHFRSDLRKSPYHIEKRQLRDEPFRQLKHRIIVTTNNMTCALTDGRFDYVIVDEAGHAHEPEIIMPATCLAPDGCLVLAGDPRQLGPVIHCKQVEALGLGQSMLERLFKLSVYSHDHQKGYDQRYITQLKSCYRCDPRILVPCNKLFYHEELNCLGQTPEGLLKELRFGHPLVFKPVQGQEVRIQSSTSCCNPMEADECVRMAIKLLKMGLKPKQIGIISVYTLQKEKIMQTFKCALRSELAEIIEALKYVERDLDYLSIEESAEETRIQSSEQSDEDETAAELTQSLMNMSLNKEADDKSNEEEKKQNMLLKKWLCQIDTVDGFQGKEKEVIIISTVRCPKEASGSIKNCNFLADSKRFNVAISRAKWLAMVVGHPAVLSCHENWLEFNKHAVYYDT